MKKAVCWGWFTLFLGSGRCRSGLLGSHLQFVSIELDNQTNRGAVRGRKGKRKRMEDGNVLRGSSMLLMTLLLRAASRSTTNSKPSLDTSVMYFPPSMIRVCAFRRSKTDGSQRIFQGKDEAKEMNRCLEGWNGLHGKAFASQHSRSLHCRIPGSARTGRWNEEETRELSPGTAPGFSLEAWCRLCNITTNLYVQVL